MAQFGRPQSQREQDRATGKSGGGDGAGRGELWLKTFRDASTPIRVLWDDPANSFVEIREHFDKRHNLSYPCAKHEGSSECIGCDLPVVDPTDENALDVKATMTSGKWIFPAIDPKGYISVYKIGFKLWDDMRDAYDLIGSITEQDFEIRREQPGDWNSVVYKFKPVPDTRGERKPKSAVPTADTISEILGKKYLHAMETYGYEVGDDVGEDPAPVEPVEAKTPGDPASDRLAAAKNKQAEKANSPVAKAQASAKPKQAEGEGQDEPKGPGLGEVGGKSAGGEDLTPINAREASPSELKAWLDNHPDGAQDYPARASRSVLIGIVEGLQVQF